jgi:hypothetical protein
MSTENTTTEYLLLFNSSDWDRGLSTEQLQKTVDQFFAWFEDLKSQGKFKAGQALERSGRIVSGKSGRVVADGPFAESKEAIGGFFLLQVADLDEAIEIAQGCPMLEFGATIQVRPIADECPCFRRVKAKLAEAAAA